MPGLVSVAEFISYIVDGDLVDDGIQHSTEVNTSTANVDVTVLQKTEDPGLSGELKLLEFGLSARFRSVTSATADLIWKWQARNKDGNWVDLHSAVTETNIGTSYVSRTRSGYKKIVTNLNTVPLDIRLILQCNEINEGRAQVKNSSYVRYRFA